MPILKKEPDCYPLSLLTEDSSWQRDWWLLYTKSRQEKKLMRQLRSLRIQHYGPQIEHRHRSSSGRIRTSYAPLFNNYVFLCGKEDDRYQAVCTGCVQKATLVTESTELVTDLLQIHDLINLGVPLTVEGRLRPGQQVRIKSGSFAGYEGTIIQRHQETRLLVAVRFMDQGVSVKLDDCQLEPLDTEPKAER